MRKTEKQQVVEELNRTFQESQTILLVDFTGLNVTDATKLRRKVREASSSYRVVKNSLAVRALSETPAEELKQFFVGPTALACTQEDPVALAKIMWEFVRDHPGMSLKAGLLESNLVSGSQVEALAKMPSRPELLTQLAFSLQSPLNRLVGALQASLRDLTSVLGSLKKVKNQTQ